jgi:predicted transcriptional regulator
MSNPATQLDQSDIDDFSVAEIEEGIADADAGRVLPYAAVRKWLLSWGTADELPPPTWPSK